MNRRRLTGDATLRLIDQAAWSGALFLFNLSAARTLDITEFAHLAASMAIAFIAIAGLRGWAAVGPVMAQARRGMTRPRPHLGSALASTLTFGAAAMAGTAGMLAIQGAAPSAQLLIFTFSVVLADTPRQVLTYSGRYARACFVSVIYLVLALTSFFVTRFTDVLITEFWTLSAIVAFAVGLLAVRNERGERTADYKLRSYLTVETLYTAVASQFALLVLSAMSLAHATTGFRLAYSVVFAPVFMLIQGFTPIYIRLLSRDASSALLVTRLMRLWGTSVGVLMLLAGASAGLYLAFGNVGSSFESALPFLIPVGLSILGAQALEGAINGLRLFWSPGSVLRLRLASVTAEFVAQVVAVVVGGIDGLMVVIAAVGLTRVLVASWLSHPRRLRGQDSRNRVEVVT